MCLPSFCAMIRKRSEHMARKCTQRSKEEKMAIVKDVLSGTPAQEYENKGIVNHHTVMRCVKKWILQVDQKRAPNEPLRGIQKHSGYLRSRHPSASSHVRIPVYSRFSGFGIRVGRKRSQCLAFYETLKYSRIHQAKKRVLSKPA